MSGCHQKFSEATAAVGGRMYGEDRTFAGVSTDTRTVSNGQLFVALKGPNFDAHEFVRNAVNKGLSLIHI